MILRTGGAFGPLLNRRSRHLAPQPPGLPDPFPRPADLIWYVPCSNYLGNNSLQWPPPIVNTPTPPDCPPTSSPCSARSSPSRLTTPPGCSSPSSTGCVCCAGL